MLGHSCGASSVPAGAAAGLPIRTSQVAVTLSQADGADERGGASQDVVHTNQGRREASTFTSYTAVKY